MRLVSYRGDAGEARSGVLDGDLVIDIAAAAPLALADAEDLQWDMLSILRGNQDGVTLENVAEILAAMRDSFSMLGMTADDLTYGAGFSESGFALVQSLAQVTLLPPLPLLSSLREYDTPQAGLPAFRYANHLAVIGAQQTVFAPTGGLTCVPSLGLVIGRGGRTIEPDAALEHVAGLLLLNGWQRYPRQPRRPRDLPTSCGPWLATLDELEMYLDDDGLLSLDVLLDIADRTPIRANPAFGPFRPADVISDVSQDVDLLPGDLICWPLLPPAPFGDDERTLVQWGDRVVLRATALGRIETIVE